MSDPAAFVLIAAFVVTETFIVAAIARGVLSDVAAGSLDMRLATARGAFYGAALMPLAAIFPKEFMVELGPERIPLFSMNLPSPDFDSAPDAVRWIALAILAVAAIGALYRIGRTLASIVAGERLVIAARRGASRFRHLSFADVDGPMVAGLFRPMVILPRRFESAPRAERRQVLRHEYAHLRRRDLRAALIQRLVEDLLWWNPFLARIGRYLAELREMASDEAAAGSARPGRRRFARVLFAHADGAQAGAFGLGAAGSAPARRIERLVTPRRPLSAAGLLLLLAAFGLAFFATPRSPDAGVTRVSIATS